MTVRPLTRSATPEHLAGLMPLGALSQQRLRELAEVASVEYAPPAEVLL